MALETLVAYAAIIGLPLWLVVEEVLHRFDSATKTRAAAPAMTGAQRPQETAQVA